MSAMRFF
jgi:hypothetical protein